MTYNEELNIAETLDSVPDWANEIMILDSFGTVGTLEIVRRFKCQVAQREFEDYAKQRNYAFDHMPIHCEWVLFLDADEWLHPRLIKRFPSAWPGIAASPRGRGLAS